MSTWTSITLGNFNFSDTQNGFDKWYFLESDRVREVSKNDDAGKFCRPFTGYRTTVAEMRRRLCEQGINLASIELDFSRCLKNWRNKYEKELIHLEDAPSEGGILALVQKEWFKQVLPALQFGLLEDWLSRLHKANEWPEVPTTDFLLYKWKETNDPILSLMLSTTDPSVDVICHSGFNFPCSDPDFYALAVLMVSDDDALCELNLHELIADGILPDFDDLEEQMARETLHLRFARKSIEDIRYLMQSEPLNLVLMRMCYSGIITVMEAYLSDIFITSVTRPQVRRRFVENHDKFKSGKKESLSEVFKQLDDLDKTIEKELFQLSFHHIPTVTELYSNCLHIEFPEVMKNEIGKAVMLRHDIVHRNGRSKQGEPHTIKSEDVKALEKLVTNLIPYVDKNILDSLKLP